MNDFKFITSPGNTNVTKRWCMNPCAIVGFVCLCGMAITGLSLFLAALGDKHKLAVLKGGASIVASVLVFCLALSVTTCIVLHFLPHRAPPALKNLIQEEVNHVAGEIPIINRHGLFGDPFLDGASFLLIFVLPAIAGLLAFANRGDDQE